MKILMSFESTAVHTVYSMSVNAGGVTAFSNNPLQTSYLLVSMTSISPSSLHFFFHHFLPKLNSDLCKTEGLLYIKKK